MNGANVNDVNTGASAKSGASTADIGRITTMFIGVLMAIGVSPPTRSETEAKSARRSGWLQPVRFV